MFLQQKNLTHTYICTYIYREGCWFFLHFTLVLFHASGSNVAIGTWKIISHSTISCFVYSCLNFIYMYVLTWSLYRRERERCIVALCYFQVLFSLASFNASLIYWMAYIWCEVRGCPYTPPFHTFKKKKQ